MLDLKLDLSKFSES